MEGLLPITNTSSNIINVTYITNSTEQFLQRPSMQGYERLASHILILLINPIAIFFTLTSRTLRNVASNRIFVSICTNHLLFGVLDLAWDNSDKRSGHGPYMAMIIIFSLHAIFTSMVAITMDRLFAIKYPLRYVMVAKSWSYWMAGMGFIVASVLLIAQALYEIDRHLIIQAYAMVVMVLFNIVVLSIANIILFLETRKHIISIRKQKKSVSRLCVNTVSGGKVHLDSQHAPTESEKDNAKTAKVRFSDHNNHLGDHGTQKWRSMSNGAGKRLSGLRKISVKVTLGREVRAAYLCIRMVVAFAILWLPWSVERILMLAGKYDGNDVVVRRITLFMGTLNSAVHPLLFIASNRVLKSRILKAFKLQGLFKTQVAIEPESSLIST